MLFRTVSTKEASSSCTWYCSRLTERRPISGGTDVTLTIG